MKANYQIHVPNTHRHVGMAAHKYITTQVPGVTGATLSYGHPHDALHVWGEESPELDSHVKQTGTLIAGAAGLPTIDVFKHGKNLHQWTMRNPSLDQLAT